MKIGFVIDDSLDRTDGVQQYVLTVGTWFSEQGHEVHYLAGETMRRDIPNVHSLSHNLKVKFNHNWLTIPWLARRIVIRRLLKEQQFDILHVQMPYSPLLAGVVLKHTPKNTAVIGTFHILPFSRFETWASKFLWLINKHTLRRFDKIVTVSPAAATFAKQALNMDMTVVPNAIALQLLALGTPLQKYSDGKLNIMFLGRLVERKGCGYLLQAIKRLHSQGDLGGVRVVICGTGSLEKSLRRYVLQNELHESVEFVGFIDEHDKPGYLASADIAVFPSIGGESFGIVLIEAMAAGAGVVLGGNNPGYASVLGDPRFLVNPRDTSGFAGRLKQLIDNRAERDELHTYQKEQITSYDIQRVGAQLLGIYKQALQQRRSMR